MTRVSILRSGGYKSGFIMEGHTAGCDSEEGRLVCAALSSAAYMCANTLTEILLIECMSDVRDGYMRIEAKNAKPAQDILDGFCLHIKGLQEQYPDYITLND